MIPAEVFLSHASADASLADAVALTLRRHGVPVWYSRTNIVGARQWHDEIGAALHRCDWFVVLLSRRSVESVWVKRELVFALQQPRYENRITPVLMEDCDYSRLSWTLSAFQRIDFRTDANVGRTEMLRMWGIGFQPETTSVEPPAGA